MNSSNSAPVLRDSSHRETFRCKKAKTQKHGGAWPTSFINRDQFNRPGPGHYNANAGLCTMPRVLGGRFSGEDRFKYLAPMSCLEKTSTGLAGGLYVPQTATSPGPSYMPEYRCVEIAGRSSSFAVQTRDSSSTRNRAQSSVPGPGLYDPSDYSLSTKRSLTCGGSFLADDRYKYFGVLEKASMTPFVSQSPGPLYNPRDDLCIPRAPSTTFRTGKGYARTAFLTWRSATPGPGAYDVNRIEVLSSRPRVQTHDFGMKARSNKAT